MEIPDIKSRLSLREVLAHYGLKPDRSHRLHCPFHEDKTPSMQVYYKTQTAYCFSSNCKTHGHSLDVIDFILHKENCTKHEAILKAQELVSGTAAPVQSKEIGRRELLERMFGYFSNAVPSSKTAKEYLAKRHLDFRQTEVGYNSGQFHHGSRKDKRLIESCVQHGLLLDQGSLSRMGNPAYKPFGKWCAVFPLKNKKGEIVSLYFRSTLEGEANRHFYLRDRQGLYPHYPKAETAKLILCESVIDAATLLEQDKIRSAYGVLALYGTNGLTQEHQEAVASLENLEEIVLFMDGDEAGRKAAQNHSALLSSQSSQLKLTQVDTPEGEDINSLLDAHEPEILFHLLENRKSISFSNEKKEIEEPEAVAEKSQWDTSQAHNLKFQTSTARYQIKGFKPKQTDSLKITLQVALNG